MKKTEKSPEQKSFEIEKLESNLSMVRWSAASIWEPGLSNLRGLAQTDAQR